MSLADPKVFHTFYDDGSADFTLTLADDDHKFSVSQKGDTAWLEYEETLSWRGQICVSEPDEAVWKLLMSSDEITDYLESEGLNGVRRKRYYENHYQR